MNNSSAAPQATLKQQCMVTNLYFALLVFAILYAGGVVFFAYRNDWRDLLLWLVMLPGARWVGLRLSPFTSRWRGQGSVADKLPSSVSKAPVEVAFYSHNGCPYCPIVQRRLEALRKEMDFTLTKIDLSFKPQLAASKGIQSVPVVEVGKERLMGNATTEQLAQLIAGAQA
jgi:thiol-disulfide isomerase/thioredoxin